MRRLSAALAALVLGICLHLALGGSPLVAQEPCPQGTITVNGTGGCGQPAERAPSPALPARAEAGSDRGFAVQYSVTAGSDLEISVATRAGAFLIGFDPQLGTFRAFDLGRMGTFANSSSNVSRIHGWLRSRPGSGAATRTAVSALLASVDADKNEALADSLRQAQVQALQQDCEDWVLGIMRTIDAVLIPLVRTKNRSVLTVVNNHPYMNLTAECWSANPSSNGTHWYKLSCQPLVQFYTSYARTLVFHHAYNSDFLDGEVGETHVRHWVNAWFQYASGAQDATFDYRVTGLLSGILFTGVQEEDSGGTC